MTRSRATSRRGAPGLLHAAVALGLLASSCGAKSGLDVPDVGPPDVEAPPDALEDAGPPPSVCIEAPPEAGPVTAELTLPVSLVVVDLFFLIDATASMVDEIDNVRARLRSRVVPGVRAAIPDAAFGLALVGEFPVPPHAPAGGILPYEMRAPITTDVSVVEAALGGIPSWGNRDEPEAQVEGLYQVATGAGLAPWIPSALGCSGGGLGGACFRPDSLPVVMLITDAPFHNGPPTVPPVENYDFSDLEGVEEPHSYDETLAALAELDILVMGLWATDVGMASPRAHVERVARDTGAVDETGEPLAFGIGGTGSRVGQGIVDAVQRLAEGLPLDVDAVLEDVPGDAIDARDLVTRVRALAASPASGVARIEGDRFVGVRPGTTVSFEVEVDSGALPPSESTRRVPARMIFRAFGRSRLGRQDIEIVVPGRDGAGCDTEVP